MIDATHLKVHPHAVGAVGGNQSMSRSKGFSTRSYIWPWMRNGMPIGIIRPLRKLHYLKFQVANARYEVESEAEPFSSVSVFIRDNFVIIT